MKKILTISMALLGIALLSGCSQQSTYQTQPVQTPPTTTRQPAQTITDQQETSPILNDTAKTVPPVGWQNYKNEKYAFEISYPKDWKLNSEDNDGLPFFIHTISTLENSDNIQMNTVFNFSSKGSLEANVNWFKKSDWDLTQPIAIENGKAFYIVNNNPAGREPGALLVSKDTALQISYTSIESATTPQTENFFKQVLSTFRFTQ